MFIESFVSIILYIPESGHTLPCIQLLMLVEVGFIFEKFYEKVLYEQKQKEKSRAAAKKIFSFFYRVNGSGMMGFTGALTDAEKAKAPFIKGESKTARQAG